MFGSAFRDCGRADDIRFGDPILVCLGVVARGGGKRGVLRICNVSSTSGAEPVETRQPQSEYALLIIASNVLSCSSIAFELDVPSAAFCGE
jgi:hypothetical protein